MKKVLMIVGFVLLLLVLLGAGGFTWARGKAAARLDRIVEVHTVSLPVPFPLDAAEVEEAGFTPEQADSAALARALDRGRHLVASRYACTECHGADFGGGEMIDDPMIGTLLGPNITGGPGGRIAEYTSSDWDRIVRHGVLPDDRPAAMPSEDFRSMSDQELSDIIAFIRSRPPVDATVPPPALGPLGTVLVATGEIRLSADVIDDHVGSHEVYPPETTVSVEFGRHLAGICVGCHKADLSGGKVPGGDPSWPAAANLTPVAGGFGEWSYEDFLVSVREGVRPDGRRLLPPMDAMVGYTREMTETELEALWVYLRSLPPTPTTD